MSDYITTFGGTHFYPLEPKSEDIHITDIAHALSMICRGNGHVKHFFSVGQHCINCAQEAMAQGLDKRVCLACLLHDAGEAYLSDVPRPFKKTLPAYQALEQNFLAILYEKYIGGPLTEEEQELVRKIDDDMLYYDLKELLGELPEGEPPKLAGALSQECVPFYETERKYLELFYALWTPEQE